MAPERISKCERGTHVRRERPNFFCRASSFFLNNRFGERFRDGQYSLVSLLFAVLLLTVSLVPYRVGATDAHTFDAVINQNWICTAPICRNWIRGTLGIHSVKQLGFNIGLNERYSNGSEFQTERAMAPIAFADNECDILTTKVYQTVHKCMQRQRHNTCIAPQAAYRSWSDAVHVTDSGRTAYRS